MSITPKIKFPYRFVNPESEYPDNRDIFLVIHVRSPLQWTKILSSGLEGAYLLYPEDHHDVSVPLMEAVMNCDSIASCLIENPIFLEGLSDYLLNDPSFTQALGNQITQTNQIEGNANQSDNALTDGLSQRTTSLDVVWGGSREVIEYMLDIVKTICFFVEGIGDLQDAVTQIYSKDKRKRYDFEAEDALNNPVTIGNDGEIVNQGGEWEFVPNILGQLVYSIGESTMLGFLTQIAGLGANLILADITDTREEALACIMFNTITCSGATQKPPPYEFNNEVFYAACNAMLLNLDAGLAGQAVGILGAVAGTVNSFVSVFPLNEVHRNFRIGMRNPSSEWEEVCESCQEPENWTFTFDFTVDPYTQFWDGVNVNLSGWSNPETTQWLMGKGWGDGRVLSNFGNQSEIARIKGTFDTSTITSIGITMEFIAGSNGAFSNQLVLSTTPSSSFYVKTLPNTGGLTTESRAFSVVSNEFYVQVRGYTRAGNNDPQGETWIRQITFTGTGFNPFV